MQNDINLRKLLISHENEVFYSPAFGYVTYLGIDGSKDTHPLEFGNVNRIVYFMEDGKILPEGECILFPSKQQRDWIKWDKEHNPIIPKTWEEISKVGSNIDFDNYSLECYNLKDGSYDGHYSTSKGTKSIEKSVLALLKIYQLIDKGYGGNITTDEWCGHINTPIYAILPEYNQGNFLGIYSIDDLADKGIHRVAFHTKKQAEEFLFYPENVQLLKDYYML